MGSHHESETLEEAVRRVMRRNIPRTNAYWIGDRRPFGVTQQDGPLDVVLWVERESGETRSATPVPTGTDPEALAWELLHTMECDAHELPPSMPAVVAVSSARDAEHLRTLLRPLDIDVVQRNHHDMLDPILSELVLEPTTKCGTSYIEVPGVEPQRVAVLFELATRFYLRCPWSNANLKPHLVLPRTKSMPQVTVKLNTSTEDPELQLMSVGPGWPSRNPATPDVLVMTYLPAETLAQELLDDIRAHHWLCSPDLRAPILMVMPPGKTSEEEEELELPEPAQIEMAIQCFERLLNMDEPLTFSVEQALQSLVGGAARPAVSQPTRFMVTMRAEVRGVEPPIWRRFRMPADITLDTFHKALQHIIGWRMVRGEHEFYFKGRKLAGRKHLDQIGVAAGESFEYLYKDWIIEIAIESAEPQSEATDAICLEGERCAPYFAENATAYTELLDVLDDTGHPQHTETVQRVGPRFRPEYFDANAVNKALKLLARYNRKLGPLQ
jgi:hypothetical protein